MTLEIIETSASNFLEIASEKRLEIILHLQEKNEKLSGIAKKLDCSMPETYRNCERLLKTGMICKDSNGLFGLTPLGRMVCDQLPTFSFVSDNKDFFINHNFDLLPLKFKHRIGELSISNHVKGFSKVLQIWKDMFNDADKYILGIVYEEPLDLIETIVQRASDGIQINSIFSQSPIILQGRKQIVQKPTVRKLFSSGMIQRKINKKLEVIVVLNEKRASVIFQNELGEFDFSQMFYSNSPVFHEWCYDYFWHKWDSSNSFQECKLVE